MSQHTDCAQFNAAATKHHNFIAILRIVIMLYTARLWACTPALGVERHKNCRKQTTHPCGEPDELQRNR